MPRLTVKSTLQFVVSVLGGGAIAWIAMHAINFYNAPSQMLISQNYQTDEIGIEIDMCTVLQVSATSDECDQIHQITVSLKSMAPQDACSYLIPLCQNNSPAVRRLALTYLGYLLSSRERIGLICPQGRETIENAFSDPDFEVGRTAESAWYMAQAGGGSW